MKYRLLLKTEPANYADRFWKIIIENTDSVRQEDTFQTSDDLRGVAGKFQAEITIDVPEDEVFSNEKLKKMFDSMDVGQLIRDLGFCSSDKNKADEKSKQNEAVRSLLISKFYDMKQNDWISLDVINSGFGTTFSNGLYQMAFVKLSTDLDRDSYKLILNEFSEYAIKHVDSVLKKSVFDIVYRRVEDGVVILLNYSDEVSEQINRGFNQIFHTLKSFVSTYSRVRLCMFISSVDLDISAMPILNQQLYNLSWSSLILGRGRIFRYGRETELSGEYSDRIHDIYQKLNRSIDYLNLKTFHSELNNLFAFPYEILSHSEIRVMLRSIRDKLLLICQEFYTRDFYNSEKNRFFYKIHTADTVFAYKTAYAEEMNKLLEQVIAYKQSCMGQSVRKAMTYIQGNYDKPLSLDAVSRQIELSPVYFSALFKKETGKNFLDYVAELRIEQAKKMLVNTHSTVSEIAEKNGYTDIRYFGRVFKKITGMTPTEYRKFNGKKGNLK